MGKIHRYYTKEDMKLLECAGRLLEAGVTMEELQSVLPDMLKIKEQKIEVRGEAVASDEVVVNDEGEIMDDMALVRLLERVLLNNNVLLEQGITDMVTESLKKEVSYLLLAKDQVEEERYKRLDTLIRQQQEFRKETSKRGVGEIWRERFGFA